MALPLPFLRPRALPRASTIQQFLRSSSTATPTISTHIPSTPLQNVTTSSKPYRITLTKSTNYPVYELKKRGGNMHITKVKHIEGDIEALKTDLQTRLGVKEISINQLTRHIIVKGHHMRDIKAFFDEGKVGYKEVVELL